MQGRKDTYTLPGYDESQRVNFLKTLGLIVLGVFAIIFSAITKLLEK